MATLKPTSISLPADLQDLVKAEAEIRGVSVTAVIRWALAERYKKTSIMPVPAEARAAKAASKQQAQVSA